MTATEPDKIATDDHSALCPALRFDHHSSTSQTCDKPEGHEPAWEHHDPAWGPWTGIVTAQLDATDAPFDWPEAPQTAYERSRARAELLLGIAADACEPEHGTVIRSLSVEQQTVLAQVGTGYATLAQIDHATQLANAQASLLGSVLEAFQGIVGAAQPAPQEPDLIITRRHQRWDYVGRGKYLCEDNAGLEARTRDELRQSGPTREYALLPHTPTTAQEADAS